MRIFILEDEAQESDRIVAALSTIVGVEIVRTTSGEEALAAILADRFDCLILDRMVHGLDGLSVLEAARARDVETPALMLTGLSDVARRTEGLDRGADDYLTKPYAAEELVARVRALARRAERTAHPRILRHGALELATRTRTAYWAEQELALTPKEFDVLLSLAEHDPDTVSLDMLWQDVWPEFRNLTPQISVIHVTMSRLRAKLTRHSGHDLIRTIKLKGYALEAHIA